MQRVSPTLSIMGLEVCRAGPMRYRSQIKDCGSTPSVNTGNPGATLALLQQC